MTDLLPGEWLKIFQGTDISVMISIGAIAGTLRYRLPSLFTEGRVVVIVMVIGAAWGLAEAVQEGYGTVAHVLKGAILNVAAAEIITPPVGFVLRRFWKATDITQLGN